jgi:hypothetical protein
MREWDLQRLRKQPTLRSQVVRKSRAVAAHGSLHNMLLSNRLSWMEKINLIRHLGISSDVYLAFMFPLAALKPLEELRTAFIHDKKTTFQKDGTALVPDTISSYDK